MLLGNSTETEYICPSDPPSAPFFPLRNQCLLALRKLSSYYQKPPLNTPTIVTMTGKPGRPILNLYEFVELLREAGYTWLEISRVLGTRRSTFWRRLTESGITIEKYSEISDSSLDLLVRRYGERNPHCGQIMLQGYLRSVNVQRKMILESIARVDPLNSMMRRHHLITRRVYKVPGSNSLWHIDGHHSLIRRRFVIHGGIDVFSRMITYLHCSTNNLSATVMILFYQAIQKYEVPSRVQSDKGG